MFPRELVELPILTEKVREERNEFTQWIRVSGIFMFIIFIRIPLCHTSSKAFDMSKKKVPTFQPLFKHSFVL